MGDTIRITQPTAHRAIHDVTRALARRIGQFVHFPDGPGIEDVKEGFHLMRGFPGVIGCVDGTHVWITRPHNREVDFVNRKGYHSINVLVVCDHLGRWQSVVARWPGSTHDSRVLHESTVSDRFEGAEFVGYILGDSGYRCTSWLMTPLLNPATPAERRYNNAHKGTRVLVEQSIGRWKRRFHVLHSENRMKDPESTCKVIAQQPYYTTSLSIAKNKTWKTFNLGYSSHPLKLCQKQAKVEEELDSYSFRPIFNKILLYAMHI